MIQITYDEGRREVMAAGHALFAPMGEDIVCAGVSAAIQVLANVWQVRTNLDVANGVLRISSARPREDKAIFDAVALTLEDIARACPKHVEFERIPAPESR